MRERVTYAVLFIALVLSACCVQEQQTTTTTTSFMEQTTETTEAAGEDYTCSDSDGGLNAGDKGNVGETYGRVGYTYYDGCVDNDTVLEYYCNGSMMMNTSVDCQRGYLCIDGACADIHAEKKPNGLECGGDQECASGYCTLNYNYTNLHYPTSKICCEEGECGFRGRCYYDGSAVWMCVCRDSQLVACTTTTSRWY